MTGRVVRDGRRCVVLINGKVVKVNGKPRYWYKYEKAAEFLRSCGVDTKQDPDLVTTRSTPPPRVLAGLTLTVSAVERFDLDELTESLAGAAIEHSNAVNCGSDEVRPDLIRAAYALATADLMNEARTTEMVGAHGDGWFAAIEHLSKKARP